MDHTPLTSKQIKYLYKFCIQKEVYEYEVQLELVDHLASSIEFQMSQNPDIKFPEALEIASAGFGNKGFYNLVRSKKKAIEREYNRLFWKFILSYFKLPRVIMTIACTISIFSIFRIFHNQQAILVFFALTYMAIVLWYFLFHYPKHIAIDVKAGKHFLLINYFNAIKSITSSIFSLLLAFANILFDHIQIPQSMWVDLTLSFLIVFAAISLYALIWYLPNLVRQHFIEKFPTFVKASIL